MDGVCEKGTCVCPSGYVEEDVMLWAGQDYQNLNSTFKYCRAKWVGDTVSSADECTGFLGSVTPIRSGGKCACPSGYLATFGPDMIYAPLAFGGSSGPMSANGPLDIYNSVYGMICEKDTKTTVALNGDCRGENKRCGDEEMYQTTMYCSTGQNANTGGACGLWGDFTCKCKAGYSGGSCAAAVDGSTNCNADYQCVSLKPGICDTVTGKCVKWYPDWYFWQTTPTTSPPSTSSGSAATAKIKCLTCDYRGTRGQAINPNCNASLSLPWPLSTSDLDNLDFAKRNLLTENRLFVEEGCDSCRFSYKHLGHGMLADARWECSHTACESSIDSMCLNVRGGEGATEECHVCCSDEYCMQAPGVEFTAPSGFVGKTASFGLMFGLLALFKIFF
jgi:hypothetical protein